MITKILFREFGAMKPRVRRIIDARHIATAAQLYRIEKVDIAIVSEKVLDESENYLKANINLSVRYCSSYRSKIVHRGLLWRRLLFLYDNIKERCAHCKGKPTMLVISNTIDVPNSKHSFLCYSCFKKKKLQDAMKD